MFQNELITDYLQKQASQLGSFAFPRQVNNSNTTNNYSSTVKHLLLFWVQINVLNPTVYVFCII